MNSEKESSRTIGETSLSYDKGKDVAKWFLLLVYLCVVIFPLSVVLSDPSEKTERRLMRPACFIGGHQWADERRYGVEKQCLACGKRR